jgi:hypothetical protein
MYPHMAHWNGDWPVKNQMPTLFHDYVGGDRSVQVSGLRG